MQALSTISALVPPINKPKNALILFANIEDGMVNVARDLINAGVQVTKVALKFSDYFYAMRDVPCVSYDDRPENFETWLRDYLIAHQIDTIIVYNQYRPYNEIGWRLAKELGLTCLVFELGYLRPSFCTIYSSQFHPLDQLADLYYDNGVSLATLKHKAEIIQRPDSRVRLAKFSIVLILERILVTLTRKFNYQLDKRALTLRKTCIPSTKYVLRHLASYRDKKYDSILSNEWSGKYFLCPLQVFDDAQITHKSHYDRIEDFIEQVADSFYINAPSHYKLIIKRHPMDRGYKNYAKLIESINNQYNSNRLIYLDRIHLPTALDNAIGTVTINSTVGLSSLIHKTPTICLGEAIYDLDGLTYSKGLDLFWTDHQPVNEKNIAKFVNLLNFTTQGKGIIYQRIMDCEGKTKVEWPPLFENIFQS